MWQISYQRCMERKVTHIFLLVLWMLGIIGDVALWSIPVYSFVSNNSGYTFVLATCSKVFHFYSLWIRISDSLWLRTIKNFSFMYCRLFGSGTNQRIVGKCLSVNGLYNPWVIRCKQKNKMVMIACISLVYLNYELLWIELATFSVCVSVRFMWP